MLGTHTSIWTFTLGVQTKTVSFLSPLQKNAQKRTLYPDCGHIDKASRKGVNFDMSGALVSGVRTE